MLLVMCNPLQVRVWMCARNLFSLPKPVHESLTLWYVRAPLQQVLGVDGVNFSVHVENQTQVRDTMSRRHHRVYQLYSRTSGKHVQVLGRRISARGEDGDKYGKTHTHIYTHTEYRHVRKGTRHLI